MRNRSTLRSGALIVIGLAMGAFATTCTRAAPNQPTVVRDAQAAPITVLPSPAFSGGQVAIADVASKAVPSVVNISATKVLARRAMPRSPFEDDPFFREFFGQRQRPEREQRASSLGSGVIVSADGVILTNNHVVEHAEDIQVSLSDGRSFDAKVVGTDPKSDLAVLRLEGKPENLQPATFGSSEALRLGDVVLAIGNPFGVGQTVTMGIVSAKGRSRMGIVDYEDFIQTDAAINPGNSGGALVNMRGELIGINTAILSRTGGSQGIGFAIPADMARPIMDSLLDDGKVERGWLGVSIQDLTPDLATGLGIKATDGVLVSDVVADSPAARGGLERGDVIVALDGHDVASTATFRNRIAAHRPGTRVTLRLLRDGKKVERTIELGELDGTRVAAGDTRADDGLLGGVTVSNLDADVRRKLDLPDSIKSGVVVTAVDPSSRAARSGIRAGDVILQLDRKPIANVGQFRDAYDAKKKSLVLLIQRGGATVYVSLRG